MNNEAGASWIDVESIAEESPRGTNGRSESGELSTDPEAEVAQASEAETTASSQADGKATRERTDTKSRPNPIATKQLSETEVLSAFEGVPEIDPIEKEKAFEKLIAMLEGGANAQVSGILDPAKLNPIAGNAGEKPTEAGVADVKDTPWPPLPPSKES